MRPAASRHSEGIEILCLELTCRRPATGLPAIGLPGWAVAGHQGRATYRLRTDDLMITNHVLYRLS